MTSYLPRPEPNRVEQDVGEIYTLAAEQLQRARSPEERRQAFRHALQRAYDAGVDAQRETMHDWEHDRPTPIPAPHSDSDETDPGTLPPGPRRVAPGGTFGPKKK
jgi:hypothetical protein